MNRALIILTLAALPSLAIGQDLSSIPAPKAPLLAPLPSLASWVVTYSGEAMDQGGNPTAVAFTPQGALTAKKIGVIRGAKNKRIIRAWSDGSTTEQWYCDGATLYEQPGTSDVYVFTAADLSDRLSFIPNFGLGDFPELGWISLKNYAGAKMLEGRPCHVFQLRAGSVTDPQELMRMERIGLAESIASAGEQNPNDPQGRERHAEIKPRDPEAVIKTAYLDVETKLPVALVSYGRLSTYTFGKPPESEPQPPKKFSDALEAYLDSLRAPQPPPR